MMARIMNPVKPLERISDPACGSGRMLMAMAKLNRYALFYGADNDRNCACMCAINMCLNSMYGEVAWMNTISNQYYSGWIIEPTISGAPRITQISEKQSYIHMKLPKNYRFTGNRNRYPENRNQCLPNNFCLNSKETRETGLFFVVFQYNINQRM